MNSITRRQFRLLLSLSITASAASIVAGALNSSLLPPPLLDYQRAQNAVSPKVGELVIFFLGIPGLIAWVVALVGLYLFWPSARWLNVAAWVYLLVWMAISPRPVLSNAVTGAFAYCAALMYGMVIALIYFSPAAEWFRRK